jgi:hypothetical protein
MEHSCIYINIGRLTFYAGRSKVVEEKREKSLQLQGPANTTAITTSDKNFVRSKTLYIYIGRAVK